MNSNCIKKIEAFQYDNEFFGISFEGEIQNGKQPLLFCGTRILTDNTDKVETDKSQNIQ